MSFSSMHNDYIDPDRHLPNFDGNCFDALENEIKNLNDGRNLSCWPICSFNGKDADLEPWGCTGIKEFGEGGNDEFFYLVVGGHKALFPHESTEEEKVDMEMSELDWLEHSIITDAFYHSDYNCEWDGDDRWVASFKDDVKCEWVYDVESGDLDIKTTAKQAVEKCREICDRFSNFCIESQKQLEQSQDKGE